MESIPILYSNRELSFDSTTLEKLKYLNLQRNGKPNRYSDIVNDALEDFFKQEFPKLKIEYYIDVVAEAKEINHQKWLEEQAAEAENRRLLWLALIRLVEHEKEKIQEEEKKTGKKVETPADIRRRLANYGFRV